MTRRPRLVYISYDGMAEPLGQTQVLGYLAPLADELAITLVSFEKPGHDRAAVESEMRRIGIEWRPLGYHSSPPVASTMWDVMRGAWLVRRLAREPGFDLVHVRSYVPGCIALVAGARPLIFDIRGFWADERVEGGLWRRDGLVDRVVRGVERKLLRRAAAVVTLTRASVAHLEGRGDGSPPRIAVIPTCTEVERFATSRPRADGPHAIWAGSIGPWYRFDLAVELAWAMKRPLQVLTRQVEAATRCMEVPGTVKYVPFQAIAAEFHEGDIGLCLYQSGFSTIARAPTRAAEYLAAGMPIVVTPELGDLTELVRRERVGVVVDGEGGRLHEVAEHVLALSADAEARERCRLVARREFDREVGVDAYRELYSRVLAATQEGPAS